MLPCRLPIAPAEWRAQSLSTPVWWFYFVMTCLVAVAKVYGAIHGTLDAGDLSAAAAVALVFALARSSSKPRLFEAIEVVWWWNTVLAMRAQLLLDKSVPVEFQELKYAGSVFVPLFVPACLGMRLWHYSACALFGVTLNQVALWYIGPTSDLMYAVSPLLALFCFCLSIIQNTLSWKIYAAQSELLLEKAALDSLTSLTCDATCWLADETGLVATCDRRLNDLFGGDLKGKALTDVVASAEDASRLTDALAKTCNDDERAYAPVLLLPITVIRHTLPMNVDLFIIRRNFRAMDIVAERQFGDRTFFVGIRCGKDDVLFQEPESLQLDDVSVGATSQHESDETEEQVCAALETGGSVRSDSRVSLPRTTVTGRIFNSANDQADVGKCLADMKALAEKQKWFIPPEDMKVRVECVLGEGAFGSVVAGSFHGASVVVKLPKIEASSKGVKELCNELRVLRHARHPNLVQCFGAVIDVTCCRFGLVLELVHGENLRAFRFHMSEIMGHAQRFQVIAGITTALSYLHSMSPVVVHGDLKPENVLIEMRQSFVRPKLVDFGLSRLLTSDAKPLGGTLRWMDPEVEQQGGRRPKASADIFSFGYLIYYTVTGKLPYANVSKYEITQRWRIGILAELSWSSGSCFEVMCRDLAETCLRPVERRSNIDEISSTLFRWRNGDSADDVKDSWKSFADMETWRRTESHDPNARELEGAQTPLSMTNHTSRLSEEEKEHALMEFLKAWKLEVVPQRCCLFHDAVVEVQALCSRIERAPCVTLQGHSHSDRCDKCGWLAAGESSAPVHQCSMRELPMVLKL
eukprot:TRINITY_DN9623_c1_g1_i1.p1 TRINITY_DN9623_c1_g1~~TRINITY_DN9623_c1_g1_i1.p1  ORF type:complete len:808 (+),score=91.81 TRINITY_DN9623_c1_g1_i1:56-2479(+)